MGWYTYPHAPGKPYGPCKKPCNHKDCAKARADSAHLCRFCQKPIGYDGRIYFEEPGPVHADCLEKDMLEQNERVQKIGAQLGAALGRPAIEVVDAINQVITPSITDLVDNVTRAAPPAPYRTKRLIYTPGYCVTFTTVSGAVLFYHVWQYAGSWYLRRYDSVSAIWKLSGLQIPAAYNRKYKSKRAALEHKARQLAGK